MTCKAAIVNTIIKRGHFTYATTVAAIETVALSVALTIRCIGSSAAVHSSAGLASTPPYPPVLYGSSLAASAW